MDNATTSADARPAVRNRRARKAERVAEQETLERIAEAAKALDGLALDAGEAPRPAPDSLTKAARPAPSTSAPAGPSPAAARRSGPNAALYASALCLALGIGGVVGGHIGPIEAPAAASPAEIASLDAVLPWKRDAAAGQREGARQRDDLRALRADAAARAAADQQRDADALRQNHELRALRAALEQQKTETAALKADLAARLDRVEQDAAQRADKAAERIDRLERRLADPAPTAAIAKTEPPHDKPVRGFVLREVSRGIALIESRRGLIEVAVGDPIPGAGRVEAIEKRSGKWRVLTTQGVIDDQPE